MEKETIKALAETTARATAAALTVKNAKMAKSSEKLGSYKGVKYRIIEMSGQSGRSRTKRAQSY